MKTKRLLSVLLTLTLVLAIFPAMPQTASAAEHSAGTYNDSVYSNGSQNNMSASEVLLPDLSNLKQLTPPTRKTQPASTYMRGGNQSSQEFDYDTLPSRPVNGKDFPPVPTDAVSMYKAISPFSLPEEANVGESQDFYNLDSDDGTQINAEVAALGMHCRVYVDKNVSTYTNFKPDSNNPHTNAQEVADEFDAIYDLLTNRFGAPDLTCFQGINPSGAINILLYDIDGDENSGKSFFTAGYFYSGDFYQTDTGDDFYSNEDAVLYVDVDANHGYKNYTTPPYGKYALFGTVAHEFQHLINFSKLLKGIASGQRNYYTSDPERNYYTGLNFSGFSLWLNEGMSGLAEATYLASHSLVSNGHFNYFMNNDFYSGDDYKKQLGIGNDTVDIGYVPYTQQWRAANSDALVMANYGSSAYLMREYLEYGRSIKALLDYPTINYYGSLKNVGTNFWGAATGDLFSDFNDFFALSMLDLAVDTPDSTVVPIYNAGYQPFYTDAVANAWTHSSRTSTGTNALSSLSYNQTVDLQGRSYFSRLYLANATGTDRNAVTITIPNDSNARYYLIVPFSATGVNDRTKWNNAGKISGMLQPGENLVQVGTDNMFAVLAVSLNLPVNTETVSYDPTTAYPVTFTTPTETVNGVTASASAQFGSYQAGDTVRVTINLSGTTAAAGTHTVGLTSETLSDNSVTINPPAGGMTKNAGVSSTLSDSFVFTFTMPATAVNDLVVTHSFTKSDIGGVLISSAPALIATLTRPLLNDEVLVVAVYDVDDNLLEAWIETKDTITPTMENDKEYVVDIMIDENAEKIKVMWWWNDLDNFRPLCKAKTLIKDGNNWKPEGEVVSQ